MTYLAHNQEQKDLCVYQLIYRECDVLFVEEVVIDCNDDAALLDAAAQGEINLLRQADEADIEEMYYAKEVLMPTQKMDELCY